MSIKVRKTEHAGAKKGQGAYWGPKRLAKAGSNRLRRESGKAASKDLIADEAAARDREPTVGESDKKGAGRRNSNGVDE
jgi:hypothetical protein